MAVLNIVHRLTGLKVLNVKYHFASPYTVNNIASSRFSCIICEACPHTSEGEEETWVCIRIVWRYLFPEKKWHTQQATNDVLAY